MTADDRPSRLAAALRANLKRRKLAAPQRSTAAGEPAPPKDDDGKPQ